MGKNFNIDEFYDKGIELIEFYRKHPCIAAYELLGVDLAPVQRLIFRDMWFKNYVITIAGRGLGKTFLLGTLASLSGLLYPGYRIGLIGPVFRQSKMIFAEVEKLYKKSSIFREACEKKPIAAADRSYLTFKAVGQHSSSYIEALPLGNDGSKIRGSRFYLILVDELAQFPEDILDLVIRPMAATKLDPMANVRFIEHKNKLISMGLASEDDFEEERVNKMIMTSSGFYKFNHMWKRMKDHWFMMDKQGDAESDYSVWQVPHWDLPEGFLDMNNINEARRVMSDREFRMEYCAEMISDSEGFFLASLLEACTNNSGFSIELKGKPESSYVLGIDPNQGGGASCGVVVIKLGEINKIVNVIELKNNTAPELTTNIQNIYDSYNVVRIFMDAGGGGRAIMDLLEDGYGGHDSIIDMTDDSKRYKKGKHVLHMVNFNPAWITEANFTTLALLEDKRLMFPEPPTSVSDIEAKSYEKVNILKTQMLNIEVTQKSSGVLHFDTPKKGQNKDLYSALILAAYGVRFIEKEDEVDVPVLYNAGGLIRDRVKGDYSNSSWNSFDMNYKNSSGAYKAATLTKKF